jgi:hypothetical protein
MPDLVILAVVLAPVAALCAWGFVRAGRARRAIREALARDGCGGVTLRQRLLPGGPFGWPSRGQIVYRFIARDRDGRERRGWARWGRRWVLEPDSLELRWDA